MENLSINIIGKVANIKIDREKALNSINLEMVKNILSHLKKWENDENIVAVIFTQAGEKAFCAGGDIKDLYNKIKNNDENINDFFKIEYQMNHLIATYKKPIISLIDGITMGGGMGISMHCSHRVTTENSRFAMPENAIGLFPDIGSRYFLGKLQKKIALFLVTTGFILNAAQAYSLGVCNYFVAKEEKDKLFSMLSKAQSKDEIDDILSNYKDEKNKISIDNFSNLPEIPNDIESYLNLLKNHPAEEFEKPISKIDNFSKLSLCLTFTYFINYENKNVKEILELDYLIVQTIIQKSDFKEGVRALLIDKDHKPKWMFADFSQINDDFINSFFAKQGKDELFK